MLGLQYLKYLTCFKNYCTPSNLLPVAETAIQLTIYNFLDTKKYIFCSLLMHHYSCCPTGATSCSDC